MSKNKLSIEVNSNYIFYVMECFLEQAVKIHPDEEFLWVVAFDKTDEISFIDLVNHCKKIKIKPKKIFSWAIQKELKKIILVQSSKEKILEPDFKLKKKVKELVNIAKMIKLEIYDFLVINEKTYWSFKKNKLL